MAFAELMVRYKQRYVPVCSSWRLSEDFLCDGGVGGGLTDDVDASVEGWGWATVGGVDGGGSVVGVEGRDVG